jgi:DNA-binding transcriptional LysR family regulator
MLEGIEALIALERFGTVSEAAVRLRLTQSALSKRLQNLQKHMGVALFERDGRRLRLTAQGMDFVERARPVYADLRALSETVRVGAPAHLSVALADSIAASWGPRVMREALSETPELRASLHAHRSVLVIESVRLGRYHVGLSTDVTGPRDLIHYPLVEEPMVQIYAGLRTRADPQRPLISIEANSATWRAIEPQLRRRHHTLLARTLVPVETFSAAVQMVRADFGDGLVPLGLVLELGLGPECYRRVTGVRRPISLLTRKTVNGLQEFKLLRERLIKAARTYFGRVAGASD